MQLRPSCQNCKRYITGARGLDVKYRCIECAKVDAPPLCPPAGNRDSRRAGDAHGHGHGDYGGGGSGGDGSQGHERVKETFDLCADCYEAEARALAGGTRGTLNHEHSITHFSPMLQELAPGLLQPRTAAGHATGAATLPEDGRQYRGNGGEGRGSARKVAEEGAEGASVKAEAAAEAVGELKAEAPASTGAPGGGDGLGPLPAAAGAHVPPVK